MPIPLDQERAVFLECHHAWRDGNFLRFMDCIADDIVYIVNVDGLQVPYALSAVGKEDVRQRFEILLATFEVKTFDVEKLVHDSTTSRTVVHGVYHHRQTGEVLDIRVRFRGTVRDGRLIKIEEIHDAAYVEAFERFVFHLSTANP